MSRRVAGVLRALCALTLLVCTAGTTPVAQAQGSKPAIALLIANWTYPGDVALTSPQNDAVIIRDALESAGFATEIAPNLPTRADMLAALNAFAAKAAHADKAVVYFAGHGLETGGRYWLLPTRARLTSDTDIARSSASLDDLVAAVANASRLRVVIIDACRNNRFAANWRQAEAQAADRRVVLRTVVETNDALVAYSAKLGTAALDRVTASDTNSPFAVALAEGLGEPGVEASELFKSVSAKVKSATGGTQEPVAFGAGAPAGAAAYFRDPTLDTVRAGNERFAWAKASQENSVDSYAVYLRDHANGANSVEAQVRMARHLINAAKSPPAMTSTLTVDGVEALAQAFKQAAGGKSLHVLLKPGSYNTPEFGYSVPSDAGDIMIEGMGAAPAATTIATSLGGYFSRQRTWLKNLTFEGMLAIGDNELYTDNVVIKGQYAKFQSSRQGRFALVGGAIFADDYSDALHLSGTTIGVVSGVFVRVAHGGLAWVGDGSRLTVLDRSDLSTTNEEIVRVSDSATAVFRGNRIAVPYIDDKEPRLTRSQRLLARIGVAPRPLPAEKSNVVFDGNIIRLPRSREAAFFGRHPASMRTHNTLEAY